MKGGVDTCYVEMALKAHNQKRAAHKGGVPLKAYDAASKAIQDAMNKAGDAFDGKIKNTDITFNDCGENVFEDKQAIATGITPAAKLAKLKAVRETNIATNNWYSGE